MYPLSYGDEHTGATEAGVFTNDPPDDTMSYESTAWKYTTYESSVTEAAFSGPYDVYYLIDGEYVLLSGTPVLSGGVWSYAISGDVYLGDLLEDYKIEASGTYNSLHTYYTLEGDTFTEVTGLTDGDDVSSYYTTTGYNVKNIDFIGYLDFDETYIAMQGYTGDVYNLDDSYFGTTFYGNAVNGSASCVMTYIKNVATATTSSSMGTYEIYYTLGSSSEYVVFCRGSMSTPGNGAKSDTICIELQDGLDAESVTKTIDDTERSGLTATITRETLEDCAYCAIDSDGYIIARADVDDAALSTAHDSAFYADGGGMVYQDGKTSDDVAYYVLIMGFTGGQGNQVYEMDFEFKAEDGSGQTEAPSQSVVTTMLFSEIEYRSADTAPLLTSQRVL